VHSTLAYVLVVVCVGSSCLTSGCDETVDTDSVTVLRVANWGGPALDPDFLRLERSILEDFERQHPGVRVQVENIPGEGQYVPKLLLMFVSGTAPDVFYVNASYSAVFINNDLVMDLMPLVKQDEEFRLTDYFENVVDIARRGKRLFAIPLDFTPMMMYYNKRLFDEARVAYPEPGWTWSDFLEKARALTIRDSKNAHRSLQYGITFSNWMPMWVPWIWLNGGDVLSPDGSQAAGYFDGEKTKEAIRFLVSLVRDHRVAPSPSDAAVAGIDFFRRERAAMNVAGHWMMIEYRNDRLDFGVVPLPSNNGRPATVIYESGLGINQNTKHRDLAWTYIKYMTSDAVQKRRVESGLAISANQRVAAFYADNDIERTFLSAIEHARGPWGARVEPYAVVEDLGRDMIDDLLLGAPLDESIRQTTELIDRELSLQ
jgi:multiple sugar transport system substrate-binding protein